MEVIKFTKKCITDIRELFVDIRDTFVNGRKVFFAKCHIIGINMMTILKSHKINYVKMCCVYNRSMWSLSIGSL